MNRTSGRMNELGQDDMTHVLCGCRRGDAQSWGRLLALVRRLALEQGRWKYRLGREDAEDLAQVVQLRVAQRLPQLRNSEAFSVWVLRLTHHAAVDTLRQRRPTLSLDQPLPPGEAASEPACVERYDAIELRADLDRALSRLPIHYREPIEMHMLEGIPQDEVGQILGRPRSTVASQIERGLRRLQRSLSPQALAN